jgi:hypothetical protein
LICRLNYYGPTQQGDQLDPKLEFLSINNPIEDESDVEERSDDELTQAEIGKLATSFSD